MAIWNGSTLASVNQQAQSIATEIERAMSRAKYFADRLSELDATELTNLGFTQAQQDKLAALNSALNNLVLKYKNQTPVDTSSCVAAIKPYASMQIN